MTSSALLYRHLQLLSAIFGARCCVILSLLSISRGVGVDVAVICSIEVGLLILSFSTVVLMQSAEVCSSCHLRNCTWYNL